MADTNVHEQELYIPNDLAEHIIRHKKMFIFDVDHTLSTGREIPSKEELAAQFEVNAYARGRGGLAYSSARTSEIMMTSAAYRASLENGFGRPEPHCLQGSDMRYRYCPMEDLRSHVNLLDPDIISGFGTGIERKFGDGYQTDWEHWELLGLGHWRSQALAFVLERLDVPPPGTWKFLEPGGIERRLASIERIENYVNGSSNVAPLPGRIQITFEGASAFDQKQEFKDRLDTLRLRRDRGARSMLVVDESSPARGWYTIYLVPRKGTKEFALNRFFGRISKQTGVPTKEFELYIFGDTLTDLRSGLIGGLDASVTFILAGGSRLYQYLKYEEMEEAFRSGEKLAGHFAGENLYPWFNYLVEKTGPGTFWYKPPSMRPRTVILADAFTKKVAAESILDCLGLGLWG